MRSVREKTCQRHQRCAAYPPPNDPFDFLDSDPPNLYVKEGERAGYGLFVQRAFKKGEFIINYRGEVKTASEAQDNVYSIESGPPENLVVDVSNRTECIARFINDVDQFHVQNCRPVKVYDKEKSTWAIAIFATKNIEEEEELRYSYGSKEAPWRELKFWRGGHKHGPQL